MQGFKTALGFQSNTVFRRGADVEQAHGRLHWQFTTSSLPWTQERPGEGEDARSNEKVLTIVQQFPGVAHKLTTPGSKAERHSHRATPPQGALND